VPLQDPPDAAHADSVVRRHGALWHSRTAVGQEISGSVLAQPVNQSPALATRRRGCGTPKVDVDVGSRLDSKRHFLLNVRGSKGVPLGP
jgi:hypothetical protein